MTTLKSVHTWGQSDYTHLRDHKDFILPSPEAVTVLSGSVSSATYKTHMSAREENDVSVAGLTSGVGHV